MRVMESIIWLLRGGITAKRDILAKKQQENLQENDLIKTVISTASQYMAENIVGKINEEFKFVLGSIEKKGYQIQERMLERLFSFFTLVLACILIVLGIDAFLVDYLRITGFVVYLLLGAALLAAYYVMIKRQKSVNEI
jgi:Flp pilus assembly protein TadB